MRNPSRNWIKPFAIPHTMPTQKILINAKIFQHNEFKGDATDPTRTIGGHSSTVEVLEAVEPCTLSGLRWELAFVTNHLYINQPWTSFTYEFVHLPSGGNPGTGYLASGSPPYAPVGNVLGFGAGVVSRSTAVLAEAGGSMPVHQSGKSKALRKLKRGDKVILRVTFNNEWGNDLSITEMKNWMRGVVQCFLES